MAPAARAAVRQPKTKKSVPAKQQQPKKKKPKQAKGPAKQAPALSKTMWRKWLEYLLAEAGPRIFFATWLTGEFGLRIREALCLQRSDLRTEADPPYVDVKGAIDGARKSPGRVYIRPATMKQLRVYLDQGIPYHSKAKPESGPAKPKPAPTKVAQKKAAKTVAKKTKRAAQGWTIPKQGFIFQARQTASQKHLHYNAVYNQFVKLGPQFLKELQRDGAVPDSDLEHLRPHSGRATFITQLMAEGHSTAISMKAARHKPSSIKTHLRYGQLTLEDLRQALDKSASPGAKCLEVVRVRGGRLCEASKSDLVAARNAIVAEIRRREGA